MTDLIDRIRVVASLRQQLSACFTQIQNPQKKKELEKILLALRQIHEQATLRLMPDSITLETPVMTLPPLSERMSKLGAVLDAQSFQDVPATVNTFSWANMQEKQMAEQKALEQRDKWMSGFFNIMAEDIWTNHCDMLRNKNIAEVKAYLETRVKTSLVPRLAELGMVAADDKVFQLLAQRIVQINTHPCTRAV